jgi:hypothetical protein
MYWNPGFVRLLSQLAITGLVLSADLFANLTLQQFQEEPPQEMVAYGVQFFWRLFSAVNPVWPRQNERRWFVRLAKAAADDDLALLNSHHVNE